VNSIIPEPIPIKQCTRCGAVYPATVEFWHRKKSGKYGLSAECKPCAYERVHQWNEANPNKARERVHQWQIDNPDKTRENKQRWYESNRDKERERLQQYYQANLDKVRERVRQWQKANPDKTRERKCLWYKANPDKVREFSHRRRARKLNAEGSHTAEELKAQYKRQKGRCYWCGDKLKGEYHADHVIPLTKGGSDYISNIVCACPVCNLSKHDKLPHEWDGSGGRMF